MTTCKHEPEKLKMKILKPDKTEQEIPVYMCTCGATIKAEPIKFVVKRGRKK